MPCGECGSLSTCACHACRSRAGTIHTAAAACGGTCSWPSCTHRGAGTRCRWAPCPQCTREDTRTCLPSGSVPAPRTCTPCPSCAHLLCVLPGLSSRFLVHHPLVGCMARSFSLVLLAFFCCRPSSSEFHQIVKKHPSARKALNCLIFQSFHQRSCTLVDRRIVSDDQVLWWHSHAFCFFL